MFTTQITCSFNAIQAQEVSLMVTPRQRQQCYSCGACSASGLECMCRASTAAVHTNTARFPDLDVTAHTCHVMHHHAGFKSNMLERWHMAPMSYATQHGEALQILFHLPCLMRQWHLASPQLLLCSGQTSGPWLRGKLCGRPVQWHAVEASKSPGLLV